MEVVFWLVLVALGPATLVAGLWRRAHVLAWRRAAVATEGRIVDWEDHRDASAPVIEFTAQDGRVVRRRYARAGDTGHYPTGKPVPVWYDPRDPQDFRAQTHRLVGAGVPLLVLSLPLLWLSWNALSYLLHH